MKIETSTVKKLLISEAPNLDPVTVFLEDIGQREVNDNGKTRISRQGKIVIECYGKSWSAYWGAMGDRTVAQFFCDAHSQYLIGCLAPHLNGSRFSGDALVHMAKRVVLDCRRGRIADHYPYSMDKEQARKLFDRIDDGLRHVERVNDCEQYSDLMSELFGGEWWYAASDATEPNPDYEYLERIVTTVQQAIKPQTASEAA